MTRKPTWLEYHLLGEKTAQDLDAGFTFQEIGDELGMSKQQAYHECMVALGKLVYRLKQAV